MSKCVKCNLTFDRGKKEDVRLKCNFCENIYHPKCVDVSITVCNFINNSDNTTWSCEKCVKDDVLQNVLKRLMSLEAKIDQNAAKLSEIEKQRFTTPSSNSVNKIYCTSNNNSSGTPKRKLADILAQAVGNNNNNNSNGNHQQNTQYNSAKRQKTATEKITVPHDQVIVVSGTNLDDAGKRELLQTVKSTLNPMLDPISKVSATANGKVVIHCKSREAVSDIKKKVADKMRPDINVNEPVALKPRINVLGVDAQWVTATKKVKKTVLPNDQQSNEVQSVTLMECEADENIQLIDMIKHQNTDLMHESTAIEFVTEHKRKDGKFNVILSCDLKSMNNILKRQRLKIGWENCIVHEHINLYRCFRCNRYGHDGADCRSNITCPRCSEPHEVKECKSRIMCCSNCKEFNEKNNTELITNHPVWNNICPILQMKFQKRKERIRYNE